jgi:hypothetical protein
MVTMAESPRRSCDPGGEVPCISVCLPGKWRTSPTAQRDPIERDSIPQRRRGVVVGRRATIRETGTRLSQASTKRGRIFPSRRGVHRGLGKPHSGLAPRILQNQQSDPAAPLELRLCHSLIRSTKPVIVLGGCLTSARTKATWRKVAVREGFEPSVGFNTYGALAKRCFRPLSHLTEAGVG